MWPVGIRSLRHRNYRLFFSGQLISVTGLWMQSTAQAWLIYRLTGSALLLGLVGFANRGPIFIMGLLGGIVADRFERRKVVLWTQIASMIQALALGGIVLAGHADVWNVLALATLQGVIAAFDIPARQSFIAGMVEQDDLPNALALNSTVFNAAAVVGPALAGMVIAAAGEGICFLLNGVSYIAVIACLAVMAVPSRAGAPAVASTRQYLMEGLRFAAGSPPVRTLLMLLGMVALCGISYYYLMPIFAGEILGGGATGLGTLMGASGLGAFLGAAVLAQRQSVKGLGRVVAFGSIGFGASLVLFSLSRSFALSVLILLAVGFAQITHSAATNLLLQSLCPDKLRGRVMSLYTIMFVGMMPFGSLLMGSLAGRVGAPMAVGIGGLISAAAGALFASRIRSMRRFVRYPIPESPTPDEPQPSPGPAARHPHGDSLG